MEYKTIEGRSESSFTEKKSEFIGYLCHTETEESAVEFIEKIRSAHRKATHNCYAYIIRENGVQRHSDDGEPSGTAGVPIYEVLKKEGLTDVCCVVTRYFGGVLLGAGGLVRAYTRAAKDAVSAAAIKNMAAAQKLNITVDYSFYGKISCILPEFGVKTENEEFSDDVKISVYVKEEILNDFIKALNDTCSGKVVVEYSQKINYNFA